MSQLQISSQHPEPPRMASEYPQPVHYPSFNDSQLQSRPAMQYVQYDSNLSHPNPYFQSKNTPFMNQNTNEQQNTHYQQQTSDSSQAAYVINEYVTTQPTSSFKTSPQSEAKPYLCKKCPTAFARFHDLKRHAKKHDDVKAHTCCRCGKSFARKDSLSRHSKKSADGTNSCKEMNAASKSLLMKQLEATIIVASDTSEPKPVFEDALLYKNAGLNRVKIESSTISQNSVMDENDSFPEELYKRRKSQIQQIDKSRQEFSESYVNDSHLNDLRIQIEYLKQELWKRDKLILQLEKEKEILRTI